MDSYIGSNHQMKPRLALTMGDPAGIGPIILKALARPETQELCAPIVFGDIAWMRQTAKDLRLPLRVVEAEFYHRPP